MKLLRTVMIFAVMAAMVLSSLAYGEELQADIGKLMSESYLPKSTALTYENDAAVQTHTCEIDKVSSSGVTMHAAIDLISTSEYTDSDWESLDAWLNETVSSAIQGIAVDTESIANVIQNAIGENRSALYTETTMPVRARSTWQLAKIEVTIPYYPELSVNVNGSATQRLQERLNLLGFLNDSADGYFGQNTANAVKLLQEYLRDLEQDWLDAQPSAEPTPEPTVAPESNLPSDQPVTTEAPEPTATPMTEVNGIADALMQAYLFSSEFKITRGTVQSGDQGYAVTRIQNRLRALGYMTDAADGIYGGSTARSVRIFQYYNNLEITGIADENTQQLLFSENAKQPDNQMLASGSSGEAVKTLQQRLLILGFTKRSADGDYGANTVSAVKNLQTYMRAREERAVRADSEKTAQIEAGTATLESFLTVEVNGVADPLLLDDFYSDAFPAIPDAIGADSNTEDIVRLQTRLSALEYYYGSADGDYGSGTQSAVENFQKRHDLEQTGIADHETLEILFSENAKIALKPYVLKISIDKQRVYAYAPDENDEYTELVRTMKCSTGKNDTPTPTGTFQNGTGPANRWHYFKKFDCWAQYSYYIDGDIMFHSVLYNEKEGRVSQSSINHLGKKASHGCVRLSVEDAKWIYENCPKNTKIIIY